MRSAKSKGMVFVLVAAAMLTAGVGPARPVVAAGPLAPQATVVAAEGNDFATRVLADPWDMNALSDVSIHLNRSGQSYDTENISVANGVFSARSRTNDANFTVLFPGYEDMIRTGNMGSLKPINSATYRCLYVAMFVQGADTAAQPIWFATDALNNGVWGQSYFFTGNSRWQVYAINLPSAPAAGGTGWTGSGTWQGLRLDPTNQANRIFEVDWVRLTDCAASNATVRWSGNAGANASLWLRPQGTTRDILLQTGVNGGSGQAVIDVQGVQPGTYSVLVRNTSGTSTITGDTLVVNQAPIAQFVTPSAISGADYAAQAGNPWDFANGSDVESVHNIATTLQNGLLDMVTQSGPYPATVDGQFFLKTPVDFNGSQYRYLSYRLFTEWTVSSPSLPNGLVPWPNMPDGMVARLVWSIPGVSGQPTNRCYFVSQDIPFDIGWHTYTIDLFDPYNGGPEQSTVDCPAVTPHWTGVGPIKDIRFDPNENVTSDPSRDPITTGGPFHQQLDWLKLTAPDRVNRGTPYLIQIDLNRPGGDVNSSTFYYTTNRSNPDDYDVAARWTPTGGGQLGPRKTYVPLVQRGAAATSGADTLPQSDLSFWWNTSSVPPGTYYVCATVTMTPNTATYCSDVPMVVQ